MNNLEPSEKSTITYLVGELYRRTGEAALAAQWSGEAKESATLADHLKEAAIEQLALVGRTLEPDASSKNRNHWLYEGSVLPTLTLTFGLLLLWKQCRRTTQIFAL